MGASSLGGTAGTALAMALAPETGGASLAALGALGGAGGSALGGWLSGDKSILKDAIMGGIGGGLTGGLGGISGINGSLSGLYNGAGTAGADVLPEEAAQGLGNAGATSVLSNGISQGLGGAGATSLTSSLVPEASSSVAPSLLSNVAPSAASGIGSKIMDFAPYAGLGLASMAYDKMTAPKQVGPAMQQHPSNPGQVAPLSRTAQNVDPNSYFSPSTAEARSYFSPYNMDAKFMATGGAVNGGSSSASSSNIPATLGGKKSKSPSFYPIQKGKMGPMRFYADGGDVAPQGLGQISGPGDGKSDSIPAMLSDGEFVFNAPAVSALGNGSNDAGAKKLAHIQKTILKKHYKGGKPKAAIGLGGYA